ncbi:MAG TPA: PQQ-binding-like beta-propeller repeat protein [Planctomycetaceae bacterium]|nr:PQQ-binding-like beta-propeller repeat protein [Planctomycetaceae bacterium]
MLHTSLTIALLAATFSGSAGDGAEPNWPRWRGPHADGHSQEAGLPTTWNADSIAWRVSLPGDGQSSPVIFGERIFLTSALDAGRQRVVLCVDRNAGKIAWQQLAWRGDPELTHEMNGWASATCATDGERVYAFFGKGGLHCFTVDGRRLWSKDLGSFEGPWGTAACPVLAGDLVIQNCDADRDAALVALDKRSGAQVWRTKRPDFRGWSTPVLAVVNGREELILNGHTGVQAYDPATGAELWFCQSFNGRGEPTVTPADGLLVVLNGLRGDAYAIRPGGDGDVTATHRAWHTARTTGRDLSSPIVVNGVMLTMSLRPEALLDGYDAATGRQLFKQRVGGRVAASPVAWDGKAFFLRENGETVVIDPRAAQPVAGINSLGTPDDEIFRASLAPSDGQVFVRSNTALYCVGRRARAAR